MREHTTTEAVKPEPDALLTEIHRQAEDDPIVELAWAYRGGRTPRKTAVDNVSIVGVREISNETLLAADIVIVGTHRTRRSLNKRMRRALRDRGQLPVACHSQPDLSQHHL